MSYIIDLCFASIAEPKDFFNSFNFVEIAKSVDHVNWDVLYLVAKESQDWTG